MSHHITIGETSEGKAFKLPADTVTSTIVVFGGKGMGKTNLGSVLVEELSKAGLRWSYLDPLGVAWGLRYADDGRGKGVECVVLGGAKGDIPIEPTGGAVVADLVVDEPGNVVIDFSRKPSGEMWSIGEKVRFITEYTKRLFQRQGSLVDGHRREPFFQILDEAARYVPQVIPHGNPQLAECVGAWETLCEEGRNIGIGVGLLTQRSARINKSVTEIADAMFSFRIVGPNSIDAVMDWLGEHVPKERIKQHIENLRSLERGYCLLVSPGWLKFEGVLKVRRRETFDSSATPKPGERPKKVHGEGAKPDLDKYLARMKETIERAAEQDPAALRRRVKELERELKKPSSSKTSPHERGKQEDPRAIAHAVMVATKQYRELLSRDVQHFRDIAKLGERIVTAADRQINAPAPKIPSGEIHRKELIQQPAPVGVSRPHTHPRPDIISKHHRGEDTSQDNSAINLKAGARKMLTILAQWHPEGKTRDELGALAGFAASGGTFGDYLSKLRLAGLIHENGHGIHITDDGLMQVGDIPPLPDSTGELVGMWKSKFKAGVGRMLDVLVEAHPHALSREELGERSGFTAAGGTFGDYLSQLRRARLIEEHGSQVKAAESLFP